VFPYVYIIIIYMGVEKEGAGGPWTLWMLKFEKWFSLLLAPWEKCFWSPPGKIYTVVLCWKKSFRRPSSFVSWSGFIKSFCTYPTIHQMSNCPSFRDTYLCRCNNTIVQIRQWLSVFNGPNHFAAGTGARVKNFRWLEPEPEPETALF